MAMRTSGCSICFRASSTASRLPPDVGLDDEVEVLHLALRDAREQIVEGQRALLGELLGTQPVGALLRQRARLPLVLHDAAELAGRRQRVEADDLDRRRRRGLLERRALEVAHGAHAAAGFAGDDGVADADAAAQDQHGCHDAAPGVDLRLDDVAAGRGVGVGLQVGHLGHEQQHVEEVVEAQALLGARLDEDGLATPLLGHDAVLGELLLDLLGVGLGLVDLVHDDDDRHGRGLGVVDRLHRLRHDAVVGRHDDGGDVGHLGAAGAHGREGFVTRGVEEGDEAAVVFDLVGADVLRDAAGFAGRHLGLADGVEQARLAVVDVTHHGDHRRARLEVLGLVGEGLLDLLDLVLGVHDLDLALEVVGEDGDGLVGERLRDGHHLAVAHHRPDDVAGRDAQELGDLFDVGTRGHLDLAGDGRRGALFELLGRAAPAAPVAPVVLRSGPATRRAGVDDDAAPLAAAAARPGAGRPTRRRRALRRRVGAFDVVFVDLPFRIYPVDADSLEAGEHIVDARAALARDVDDPFLLRHLPHCLSRLGSAARASIASQRRSSTCAGERKARAKALRRNAASKHARSGHR